MRECLWICPPSLWYLCLLLSDRVSGLHGLAFSLCRSVLKPNTGIRSHLPGMAWMPSTVPVPRCHKTEVASGVTIEIGAIGRDLRWSLHNFTFHCRASGGCRRGWGRPQGAPSKHTIICLTTVVFALPGEQWSPPQGPSLFRPQAQTLCIFSSRVLRFQFQTGQAMDSRYNVGTNGRSSEWQNWLEIRDLRRKVTRTTEGTCFIFMSCLFCLSQGF